MKRKNREIRFVSSSSREKFGAEPTIFLSKNWQKIRPLTRWSTKYAFFHRYYCFIEFMYNTIVHSNLQLQKILLLHCYFKCLVVSFALKWNLPIADIPNSEHALNCSNILCQTTSQYRIPINNGQIFLRPVDVRYSEVSLY